MSANTTNVSKRKMDCGRVAREEILESFLLGKLTEHDREAFEEHYFECARCFDELQTLQAMREELPRVTVESEATSPFSFSRWIPAAGLTTAAVATIAVMLWMRPQPPPAFSELTKAEPSPQTQLPEPPTPPLSQPTVRSGPSLEELARVEPPPYEPLRLRGAPDEATKRFQLGMEHYRQADYRRAIADLRAAAELAPDATHIQFFLGVSHLMLGENAAIDRLQATIALGDSPYLEEAHLYLAKAFLRRKDLDAAANQLKKLIQLRGAMSGEAKQLLTQVEGLKVKTRSD